MSKPTSSCRGCTIATIHSNGSNYTAGNYLLLKQFIGRHSHLFLALPLLILLFFTAKKLLVFAMFALCQFISCYVNRALHLEHVPLIDIDWEVSNVMIFLSAHYFGIAFAAGIVAMTMFSHILFGEAASTNYMLTYPLLGMLIAAATVLFGDISLWIRLPWVILVAKTLVAMARVAFLREPVVSIYNISEAFAIGLYFVVFIGGAF